MSSKTSRARLESPSEQSSRNEPPGPLESHKLRPYQLEIARAILDSVFGQKGITFSVEISRQGGKNELSAQLELLILTLYMAEPQNLIKCSPTFKPQAIISMRRLKDRLNDVGFAGIWTGELGYIIRLVNARAVFLSADESANVVGNTAHLLLEVDESQDVNKDKYTRDFKPMGATTNVTTVHYGTTWDEYSLLEEVKQTNLEMEKSDGIKRHFRYDWQEVAKYNPEYMAYVENERKRLGENHPLFLTQYCLRPVHDGGGFLTAQQRAQLQGNHQRIRSADKGKIYVAGIDIAGEAENGEARNYTETQLRQDSSVVTIGEIDFTSQDLPVVKIVEHYYWTGTRHTDLYPRLIDILKNVWRCKRIVIDATGIGQPISSILRQALGSRAIPFVFTAASKSKLGFELLSAINSGRLKMYAADGSTEYRQFWLEIEKSASQYRPNQTINFYVDPSRGHDDFLMSLALVLEAALDYQPREAKGTERPISNI